VEDPDLYVDDDMEPDAELNRITNNIIGAAIAVHRELGPGYMESTYENSLALEFRARGIQFERQAVIPVLYRGEKVGEARVDFVVEQSVILELKAAESIAPIHVAQCVSYLKASRLRLAILLNFNVRKLKDGIRRIAL